MANENINHEFEKLQEAMKTYLTKVDVTNPNELSVALLQMMYLVMRFQLENSTIDFFKALTNKFENKGR